MTVQHTPGPWFVNGPYHIQADLKTQVPVIVGQALMLRNDNGARVREANALLIAAAPDLLIALKNLLARAQMGLDQSATYDGLTNCDALAAARRAITKATGEEWTYPPKAKPSASPACEDCGTTEGVTLGPCPYAEEIHGDSVGLYHLCSLCREERARDI